MHITFQPRLVKLSWEPVIFYRPCQHQSGTLKTHTHTHIRYTRTQTRTHTLYAHTKIPIHRYTHTHDTRQLPSNAIYSSMLRFSASLSYPWRILSTYLNHSHKPLLLTASHPKRTSPRSKINWISSACSCTCVMAASHSVGTCSDVYILNQVNSQRV